MSNKKLRFPKRQCSLTLLQRLSQLVSARITTTINPFGFVDAKIVKVGTTVIAVKEDGSRSRIFLSPLGLRSMSINRRAQNPTKRRFNISINSGEGDAPAILPDRRIVRIGRDFLETTVNGEFIQLIPITNVTVIFPATNKSSGNKKKK